MEANRKSSYWEECFSSAHPASPIAWWSDTPLKQYSSRVSLQTRRHMPTRSHRSRRERLRNRRSRSSAPQPPWRLTATFSHPPAPAPPQSPWYQPPELQTPQISQVHDIFQSPRYSPGSSPNTIILCDTPAAPVGAQTPVFKPKPLSPVFQSQAPYVPETPKPRKRRDKRYGLSYLLHPQNEQVPPPTQPNQQWSPSLDRVEIITPRPRAPSLTYERVEATIDRWEHDALLEEERACQLKMWWDAPQQMSPDSRSPSPPILRPAGNERLQRLFGHGVLEREELERELTRLQLLMQLEKKQLARLDLEEQQGNARRSNRPWCL